MKYKEFRMIIFSIIMFVLISGACVYFAIDHNKSKVIIGLILLFVLLSIITTKYNMKIFNDSMMIYEYKGIGILPALVDYKDIKDVELISKHKIKRNGYFKELLGPKEIISGYIADDINKG